MKNKCRFICFNHDYVLSLHRISVQRYDFIFKYARIMADFYVKYGSKNAKMIGLYNLGKLSIKLHYLGSRFVVSKNRRILGEYVIYDQALKAFMNVIYLEDQSSSLFNS